MDRKIITRTNGATDERVVLLLTGQASAYLISVYYVLEFLRQFGKKFTYWQVVTRSDIIRMALCPCTKKCRFVGKD